MIKKIIHEIMEFHEHLAEQEYSEGTIQKYLRDAQRFCRWMERQPEDVGLKEAAIAWKERLQAQDYAPVTVNSMLSALNNFLSFIGRADCRVKFLRIQRRMFRPEERNLTKEEFSRLRQAAREEKNIRLELLMETIAGAGIRVSEVKYMTVEAARQGRAVISLKGKIRTILISKKLCRRLLIYAKKRNIRSGEIFRTRSGKGMSRKQIWREMKRLCAVAGVRPEKVFPHNLRHLFATAFYELSQDIVRLADVMGHSSLDTTRIYLQTTGEEHLRLLDHMRLSF